MDPFMKNEEFFRHEHIGIDVPLSTGRSLSARIELLMMPRVYHQRLVSISFEGTSYSTISPTNTEAPMSKAKNELLKEGKKHTLAADKSERAKMRDMEQVKGVVRHIVLAKFKEDEVEKHIKDYANLLNHIEQMKSFQW
ncbi:unnamed protein product [Dovyalis caffra]|uniref:Stress-response A/B barrel domain-containing protein n=1 Tax=Dovyalis caffra TaxID=77055 RepID=A0AAV1SS35_9ROSI|nr:unnamed protein product [Dovyalis caffra]